MSNRAIRQPGTDVRWRVRLVVLSLIALTCTVFLQVQDFEFVNLDDASYVTENRYVQQGLTWENVRWAFSIDAVPVTSNWHPLTWLSLMLDAELYGTDAGGYHVTNLVLHAADVLLLFLLLRQSTGEVWKSACVSALFAIHPLHVESVAWISERKDVLSTLFGLLSLLAYVRYTRSGGQRAAWWYGTALTVFVLSLMAKQMLVTLPFLLLLLDYWPLGRFPARDVGPATPDDEPESTRRTAQSFVRLLLEKLPFLVITIVFCVVAMTSQNKGGAMVTLEQFSLSERLRNALVVSVIYIVRSVWPHNLACFYPHPVSIPVAQWAGAALLLLLTTGVVLWQRRTRPYLPVGWFWYLGTLVPVIGLVQIGSQRMADRYTYVPLIGLFLATCWYLPSLLPGTARRLALPVLTAVILALLTMAARQQTSCWRNSQTLYEHAAAVTEGNDLAHYNLADIYYERGRYTESIHHFKMVLRIHPGDAVARNGLGLALTNVGRYAEAVEQFQASLSIDETNPQVHNNLGLAEHMLGRSEQAIQRFQRAISIDPRNALAWYNLGNLYGDLGQFDEAVEALLQAVRFDPGNARFHNNLGLALSIQGKFDESIAHFDKSLEIDPDDALAHLNLGRVLLLHHERNRAIEHFREAVRLAPRSQEAQDALQDALSGEP